MVSSKLLISAYQKKFIQKITLINLRSQNLLNSQLSGWHLKAFTTEYSLKNQTWSVLNDVINMVPFSHIQWSYGVLCWEVFSAGKIPYPGMDPTGLVELLDTGQRLSCPHNEACSEDMYALL